MEKGFPSPAPAVGYSLGLNRNAQSLPRPKLDVVQVGNFEASFVPTVDDFSRLDDRFRLPTDTWSKLPDYKTYGFAVFKLKVGVMRIHPMAFSFLRRNVNEIFFPTVHIHDGKVHAKAGFDHALFCQPSAEQNPRVENWQESYTHPSRFMHMNQTKGVVLPDQHCYKVELLGDLPNRDTVLQFQV